MIGLGASALLWANAASPAAADDQMRFNIGPGGIGIDIENGGRRGNREWQPRENRSERRQERRQEDRGGGDRREQRQERGERRR